MSGRRRRWVLLWCLSCTDTEDEEALPTLRIVVPVKRKHPPVPAESSEDVRVLSALLERSGCLLTLIQDKPLSSQVHPKKIMKTGESSRVVTNPTKEPVSNVFSFANAHG